MIQRNVNKTCVLSVQCGDLTSIKPLLSPDTVKCGQVAINIILSKVAYTQNCQSFLIYTAISCISFYDFTFSFTHFLLIELCLESRYWACLMAFT